MKLLSVILQLGGDVIMTKNEKELLESINEAIFFLKQNDVKNVNSNNLNSKTYNKQ